MDLSSSIYKLKQSFSLVVIDVDDTLSPTTIRRTIKTHFGIDLFDLLSLKSLKRLQNCIVKSIDKITETIVKRNGPNHEVIVVLISNASYNWLDFLLNYENGKLSILSEYFLENNIPVISASADSAPFFKVQTTEDKWIYKYISISWLINDICKELNCENCQEIISLGDGINERIAIEKISQDLDVKCVHFEFVRYPTIYQLRKQWQYLSNNMNKLVKQSAKQQRQNNSKCVVVEWKAMFAFDNNEYYTGIDEQMPSIALYFRYWLSSLNDMNKRVMGAKQTQISSLVAMIHNKLYECTDKECIAYLSFKNIVIDGLCCHNELSDAFSDYLEKLSWVEMYD